MKQSLFLDLSIKKILECYKNKTMSPYEVANTCVCQVAEFEPQYKAWVNFSSEKLLSQSREIEVRLAKGGVVRALEGIPLGVKDIFNTVDFPTQMGSPIWDGFTPGNDARVVFYAKQAGALTPGKTVTAEFAVHTLGKTLNPHDITKTPGTSSSGSAVAVATGMVPVALGTQTAGSIVRPASFCGVYGVKPSFGLIPRTGTLKTTDSLDTVGYFVAHFEDLVHVFDVIRVHGPNFPLSHAALNDVMRQSKPQKRPWRVALVKTHTWDSAPVYAQASLLAWAQKMAKINDFEVETVELPSEMNKTHEIHATIYNKTLAYYFKKEFEKAELVSPVMNELIMLGNRISIETFNNTLEMQNELASIMDNFFSKYDVLISLSTAGHAPARDCVEEPDPALMWTMTHLPVISAPVFTSYEGLPFGVQLVARRYNDLLLISFCEYLNKVGLIPSSIHPVRTLSGAKQISPQPFAIPVECH